MKSYIVSIADLENPWKIHDSIIAAKNATEAAYIAETTVIDQYRERVVASYPFQYKDL